MSQDFLVEILTPQGEVLNARASEVTVPSYKGELGILPNHENLVGLLSTGTVKVVTSGKDFWYAVSKGAFKINSGSLTIFAEFGASAEKYELAKVEADIQKAEADLKDLNDTRSPAYVEAKHRLDKSKAMLSAARRTAMM